MREKRRKVSKILLRIIAVMTVIVCAAGCQPAFNESQKDQTTKGMTTDTEEMQESVSQPVSDEIESRLDSETISLPEPDRKPEVPSQTQSYAEPLSQPVRYDPQKPMIALTFDDGPNPQVTEHILEILKENGARATFFMVGNRIDEFKDTVKKVYDADCEIGSHTYDHKNLTKLSDQEMREQIDKVNEELLKIIPKGAGLVRPPYGAFNDNVQQKVGYPLIRWDIDTEDWLTEDVQSTIDAVIGKVSDGDIILMHDLYESTGKACEVIIPQLIQSGFQLVTVSELMQAKGITMQKGQVYYFAQAE